MSRGEAVNAVILTAGRLRYMGCSCPLASYLFILLPLDPDKDMTVVWVDSREALRELVRAESPATLVAKTMSDDDDPEPDALLAFCRGKLH